MDRRTFLSLLATAPVAAQSRKPNVVFFLMDDMGWMDSTVYGSKYYETPNMERLARRGMVFTDAYAASPLCSPTRASILTGKHPARTGITTACGHTQPGPADKSRFPESAPPARKWLLPDSLCFLKPEEHTIAEAFKQAGYRTGHIGKWHLGLNPEHWPDKQGFDVAIHGKPDPGPPSYFAPYKFKSGTLKDGPEGEYITDRITEEALKFLDEQKGEGPFLVHIWHHAVHGPWGYKEDLAKPFDSKRDPRGKQNNAIMASMLKSADDSLGRVLDKLDQLGMTKDTVFIFFSDNGGNVHSRIGPKDLPPTNNEPLSEGKGRLREGGTRVPCIVAWPGVVKPGSKSIELISSVDWYPTMLEMAGLTPARGLTLDGVSIVPALKGKKLDREAIFCYFPHGGPARPGGVYVRQGDLKLIRYYDTGPEHTDELELFNLREDLSETTNVASKMPEKVREMDTMIDEFLQRTHAVIPKPNPAYNPSAPRERNTGRVKPRRRDREARTK